MDDAVQQAMEAVIDAIEDVQARLGPIKARLDQALELRDQGHSYSEMGSGLEGPPVIEMLGNINDALAHAEGRLRRAAALELRAEGMTMEQIAKLFGVSRQRVSAILREVRSM